MKKFRILMSFAGLLVFGLYILSGCSKLNPLSPVTTGPSPTATTVPASVCWVYSPVTLPPSPSGSGNFVIRSSSDWETFNNCAGSNTCPVPPVNLSRQMLLVTETIYPGTCSCTPTSEAVSTVCSNGSLVTVDVHQTLPAECSPLGPATGVCLPVPVILESAVAVASSNLPVSWVFDQSQ
jgi:hypothetical protein